jgi:hypothetical protein
MFPLCAGVLPRCNYRAPTDRSRHSATCSKTPVVEYKGLSGEVACFCGGSFEFSGTCMAGRKSAASGRFPYADLFGNLR